MAAATTDPPRRAPRPGSAPPIRQVTDHEIRRHLPLVDYTLRRMIANGRVAPQIEYEDLQAIGRWGVWEALRRWEPSKGAQSTYLSSYISGYVTKWQRVLTRADGYAYSPPAARAKGAAHGQIASVFSYEKQLADDYRVFDTLAVEDDTVEQAHWSMEAKAVLAKVASLKPQPRHIAERVIVRGETQATVAHDLDLTGERVRQYVEPLRAWLAGEDAIPEEWLA